MLLASDAFTEGLFLIGDAFSAFPSPRPRDPPAPYILSMREKRMRMDALPWEILALSSPSYLLTLGGLPFPFPLVEKCAAEIVDDGKDTNRRIDFE